MVLKFCASLFASDVATPAAPTGVATARGNERVVSPMATGSGKQRLLKKAMAAVLLDAHEAKWEKEFRVHFDGSKAAGLGFEAASSRSVRSQSAFASGASSTGANDELDTDADARERYECVVREVVSEGLAAEYNARCRSLGDYSRIIHKGLRVRKVNDQDVGGVAYDQVLQLMRTAMPAFFLTFTDTNSKRLKAPATTTPWRLEEPSFRPRPSSSAIAIPASVATVATRTPARRNSSLGLPASALSPSGVLDAQSVIRLMARRNSSSSVVHLHSGGSGGGSSDQASKTAFGRDAALVNDLETKAKDVSDQLQRTKQQLLDLECSREQLVRERDQLAYERDALTAAKQSLETEKVQLLEERDAVAAAAQQQLARQHQSASDCAALAIEQEQREVSRLSGELAAAQTQLAQLEHERASALSAQATLQGRLVDQVRLCEENTALVEALRHERDKLALASKELQLEHADASHHAEELHARLVEAQAAQKTAEMQRAQLASELERTSEQLRDLVQGIESLQSGSTTSSQRRATALPTSASPLAMLQGIRVERLAIEQHRDELLLEASRAEQTLQTVRLEAETLAADNTALRAEVASLRQEVELAHQRQRDQQSQVASDSLAQEQHMTAAIEALTLKLETLERRCEAERNEKLAMQSALDALEVTARARLEAHRRDQDALAQFKQQLVNGIVVTKHGSRGNPHARVLFSDLACRWMSWKAPSSSVSLASPRADAKVETRDLVEVLAGATTEVFQRTKPEAPAKCLSLVFVHPCRTLDLEAETPDKCDALLRGFRLLHDEVTHKRRQEA